MRVMVTGCTGFVGFHTVMALLAAGHEVCLGVRNTAKMRRVFGPFKVEGLDYVLGSITDEAAVSKALGNCEAVVHSAAMVNLDAKQADFVRQTNVRGTELVVGGAVERGIESIVYVSSITALFTPGLDRLTEDSPLGSSSNGYGQSKVESEKYVRRLQEEGASIAVTYPTATLGPDDPGLTEPNKGIAHFLNFMFYETTSGMQMVDVRDLADIQVKLLEGGKSGRYIVGGHFLPWKELADLMEEITGEKLRRMPTPRRLMHMCGSIGDTLKKYVYSNHPITREAVTYATDWVTADNTRVEEELGFEFRDPRITLADTIRWLNEAGHIDRKWVKSLSGESPENPWMDLKNRT
jgi:dihydroflavonol-4-reductase